MTRISALLVTYQQERYVDEALRSVLDQTRPPDQVVVADDGSTDGTIARVQAVRDARVRVVELPHRGIAALAETYNAALQRADGELIATIEGDDRWLPHHLAAQEGAFADPRVVLSHGLYGVIGGRGDVLRDEVPPPLRLTPGRYDAFPTHLLMSYVMPVTTVIRRNALERIGGFRQLGATPHVDHPTYLALAEAGSFHFIPRAVALWRRHGGSGTTKLAGVDLEGTALSLELALAARARSTREDLPVATAIRRSWTDAFGRQLWNVSRILMVQRRFDDARRALARAGPLSRYTAGIRARLLLAHAAALLRVDIEAVGRLIGRRSLFEQL